MIGYAQEFEKKLEARKARYWLIITVASFALSLLRIKHHVEVPLETAGIFLIALIYDPWLASFAGLAMGMLHGFFLDKTFFFLLFMYIVFGLYWGYLLRLGCARIWGTAPLKTKLKRWAVFILTFFIGSGFFELSIKESLKEFVFNEKGLIYYREGPVKLLEIYFYRGKLLKLILHGLSWNNFISFLLLMAAAYALYRLLPSRSRYFQASAKSGRRDLLVEQSSVIIYTVGFSAALIILFLVEQSDSNNFELLDIIHTASFWGILYIVLGTITYLVGTKEKPRSYLKALTMISLPPLLKIMMITRIQRQINQRTTFMLKNLYNTSAVSLEKINQLFTSQLYQQMWVTALFTISYLLGSLIIILIIFKWNQDLRQAKDELEDQVIERSRRLQKTQEALIATEKMATLGRLSAEVAHEINNPLYGVMNYSDLLYNKIKENEQLNKYIQLIRSGLFYISAILKQLRGLSGPGKPSFAPVDIIKLLDHSLFLMDYKFGSKNIAIVRRYPGAPLPPLMADGQLLQQLFINIIHNAIQAMRGFEEFFVYVDRPDEETLEIRFKDEGVGICDRDLKNIFSPFFTTKKPEEGMGLGLTICEQIVKNHNGLIEVDSVPDQGTTFIIKLPLQQPVPQAAACAG